MRVEQTFRSAVKAADEIGFSHRGKTLGYTNSKSRNRIEARKRDVPQSTSFFYWSQILKTL
jgi:hypothetical protein